MPSGILEAIVENGAEIGEITEDIRKGVDDDLEIRCLFALIDEIYDGNLFSREVHKLLEMVDMDDILFINAIDNLCFSALSIRDIGTIYESLLDYKLAVVPEGTRKLPSIVDKKRKRKNVKDGELMLDNENGARKRSGSYFTNENIVEHLVRETVGVQMERLINFFPN